MKKIIAIILCLLLLIGAGGGIYSLVKENEPQINGGDVSVDKDLENESGEGNVDENNTPTPTNPSEGLTVPENAQALTENRLTMLAGAQVLAGEQEEIEPAIRFTCLIENSLVNEVKQDENKQIAILVAPLDYFNSVNGENKTVTDWVNEFSKAGKSYILKMYEGFGEYDSDTSFYRFTLEKVLYQNINRKMVAMGVMIDNASGTPVYKYGGMPEGETYRTNARSIAYIAGAALNANALGETSFTEEQINKLKGYINLAVDKLNGLDVSTADGSMPSVQMISGNAVHLWTSQTHQVECEITPSGLDVPILYVSSDTDILRVESKGRITGMKEGTAKVNVYVAGELYQINVTVS